MNKGYDYDEVWTVGTWWGYVLYVRTRGEEAKAKTECRDYKPRRWLVEQMNSQMSKFRRLLGRWEKKADNYLAMVQLAYFLITATFIAC